MSWNSLSQPNNILLKSLSFTFQRNDFIFNVSYIIISTFNLSSHSQDGFLEFSNSNKERLAFPESSGSTTGVVEAAGVDFFDGGFVELGLVV